MSSEKIQLDNFEEIKEDFQNMREEILEEIAEDPNYDGESDLLLHSVENLLEEMGRVKNPSKIDDKTVARIIALLHWIMHLTEEEDYINGDDDFSDFFDLYDEDDEEIESDVFEVKPVVNNHKSMPKLVDNKSVKTASAKKAPAKKVAPKKAAEKKAPVAKKAPAKKGPVKKAPPKKK